MNPNFWSNFFRKDLNLRDRWWHRTLFILFIFSFPVAIIFGVLNMFDSGELPKYGRINTIPERVDSELYLLNDLVGPGERIAGGNWKVLSEFSFQPYDRNGGWLLSKGNVYCSSDMAGHIELVSQKTGVNYYKGNLGLVPLDEFKKYLTRVNAYCVDVLALNSRKHFGDVEAAISWTIIDDWGFYKASLTHSIFSVLQWILFIALGFLLLLVLYYRVVLFIVFSSKKP